MIDHARIAIAYLRRSGDDLGMWSTNRLGIDGFDNQWSCSASRLGNNPEWINRRGGSSVGLLSNSVILASRDPQKSRENIVAQMNNKRPEQHSDGLWVYWPISRNSKVWGWRIWWFRIEIMRSSAAPKIICSLQWIFIWNGDFASVYAVTSSI